MSTSQNQSKIDALALALFQLQLACGERANAVTLTQQNHDTLVRSGIQSFMLLKAIRTADLSWVPDVELDQATASVNDAIAAVRAIVDDATCVPAFAAIHTAHMAVQRLLLPGNAALAQNQV